MDARREGAAPPLATVRVASVHGPGGHSPSYGVAVAWGRFKRQGFHAPLLSWTCPLVRRAQQ